MASSADDGRADGSGSLATAGPPHGTCSAPGSREDCTGRSANTRGGTDYDVEGVNPKSDAYLALVKRRDGEPATTAALPSISSPMAGADLWQPADPESSPGFDAIGADHAAAAVDDAHADKQHTASTATLPQFAHA